MAQKSKTVHVIELNANAKDLSNAIADLRKDLNGITLPADLEKTFSKLEKSIDILTKKTEKGVIPREDFQATEKEIGKIKTSFNDLFGSIESLKKANDKKIFSLLPEDTIAKLEKAEKAFQEYSKSMQSVVNAENALERAEAKRQAASEKATSAENSRRAYTGQVTRAQSQLEKYKEITSALEEQKKAAEALQAAQRELDNYRGKSEKTRAEKQASVDAASLWKSAADAKVGTFSKKDIEAQATASKKVEEAQIKEAAAKKKVKEANEALIAAEVGLTSAKGDLAKAQKKSEAEASEEAQALKTLKEAMAAVNPKYQDMAIEGKTTKEQLKFLRDEIDSLSDQELAQLRSSLAKTDKSLEAVGAEVDKTGDTLSGIKEEVKETDEVLAKQEAMESRIKQFLGVAGAAQVLRAAVRDAMATIKELDATMTEMAVVTDLTVGDYWDQLPEYSQRASDLGVSINSAYKAATLYYQQGLKTNEVNAISVETLKMAKIANLDAASATDKMTAALRGFNMELNEESAQRVSDVYSELAAITAADTKDIANAMTKTASIASSAGMEFETTAAFLSQIIETTRESAETAGTAMKTVIARFQELKKAPSEIGEVDGEVVDANAIETALRSVGVSLRDSAGQFRELDDVFLELSSKWDSLDKNTQRYIATIAAGSRQQSRFIAMMSDYSRTQELVTAANNSAGASNKQFEKTMDSLEAKMEKLRNAWHEFTMGIMNSELVKFGVDALTKFLEIVNKATSGLKGLGGSITKILSILVVFKLGKTIFEKLKAPMIGFFADIVREAGLTGERAGRAAQEGLERSKQGKSGEPTKTGNFFAFGWDKVKEARSQKNAAKSYLDNHDREEIVGRLTDSNGDLEKAQGGVAWAQEVQGAARKKLVDLKVGGVTEDSEEWKEASDALDGYNKDLQAQQRYLKAAEEEQQKINQELNEYDENMAQLGKANQQEWKAIGQAVQQTGAAITGVGVATSMLGGVFSALGLEEIGEGFSTAGNIITMVGGAVSTLGAIVPAVTSILSACGITLQASFWPILVIGLAIVALVGTIAVLVASFKALKAATPEGKLEAAKEKAEGLSEAAQQAADAFNELNDSVETLGDKYKEIDDMVQGTKAWKDAVREVNKQVMELIDQYPELARFVENTDGVLRIDFEKKAVQEVLDKYESRMMTTQAAEQLGNAEVTAAETDVAYSKVKTKDFAATGKDKLGAFGKAALSAVPGLTVGSSGKMEWSWADLGLYAGSFLASPIATLAYTVTDMVKGYNNSIEGDTRELNEKVAQAMNDGIVDSYSSLVEFLRDPDNGLTQYADMASEIWDNQESFEAYREALAAETAQRKAVTAAMLASAQSVADMSGFTTEDNKIMAGLEDALDINLDKIKDELGETKWHKTDKLSSEQYSQLANAVQAQYGENAKIEGNKIKYYDSDNNLQTVAIKDVSDRLIAQMASDKAVNDTKTAIEGIPELRKQFANDSNMMALLQGEGTLNQLNSIDLSGFTKAQTEALKNVYGDNYQQILEDKLKNELDGFKTAERKLKGINISETFGDVSAEAANALADIATNTGWGGTNNFVKAFQQAQGSFTTASDKNQFAALMGSMEGKETLREAWEDLEIKLKEQNLWNDEVAKFIATSMEKTSATYSEAHLAAMGVSDELYSHYQQAVISGNEEVVDNFHKTFKKWKEDYDVANDEGKKAEHELKTAISDALTKSAEEEIDKLQALTDAVNEANEKMVQAIQKQIDEQRQARDNAKEEETLNDLRNKISYLRASGASPLELMQAEEELAAAEEGYSDKLVDQSIAKLEDANEKAASQREEQINLLRSQLEFWKETEGFKAEVSRIFEETRAILKNGGSIRDTELWELLGYDKLSEYEQGLKAVELDEEFGKTIEAADGEPQLPTVPSTVGSQTAVGGASGNRTESLRFNRDLLGPTQSVIKEEGDSGLEIDHSGKEARKAIEAAAIALSSNSVYTESGLKGLSEGGNEELNKAIADYKAATGSLEGFSQQALTRAGELRENYAGIVEGVIVKGLNSGGLSWGEYDQVKVTMDGTTYKLQLSHYGEYATTPKADVETASKLYSLIGNTPTNGQIAMVDKVPYMYITNGRKSGWYNLSAYDKDDGKQFAKDYLSKLQKYETGGLADFTGPAWLDGTKSRPEYVLNSAQTERFFSLVDVLERFDTDNSSAKSGTSGDNHFEIEINVDKLENDYDVEQLADKIRRMIYDDATYRNVNAVGFIR